MLGFGMAWEEEWSLLEDGRVLHRSRLAQALKADDGVHGFAQGEAAWTEEVMPLSAAPAHVRKALQRDPLTLPPPVP